MFAQAILHGTDDDASIREDEAARLSGDGLAMALALDGLAHAAALF